MDVPTLSGLEKYEKKEKLGEGTYGVVYKAVNINNNRVVALKKIRTDLDDEGVPSTAIREIAALMELKHPNIVELIEVLNNGSELYLVFEYMDQDLRHYMDHVTTETISPLLVKSYMYQMLQGIQFCHARRILHRDLKPQNLLIDKNGCLKLADFGLARAFCVPMRQYTHEVVTLWYRAPEVLLGAKQYSLGVDTWSIGTIFAELLTKRALFNGDSEIDEIFKIFHVLGKPTIETAPTLVKLEEFNDLWPNWKRKSLKSHFIESGFNVQDDAALDLLEQFLQYEPSKRISAKAALCHPYFKDLDLKSASF